MARENQGLQIALIIFVMLTLVLGVTTFLFFRNYQEADATAKAARKEAENKLTELATAKMEIAELKKIMGFAATEGLDKIGEKANEQMRTIAGALPEESRDYSKVLVHLADTINKKNEELVLVKDEHQKLKAQYEAREASKQPQIEEHKVARAKAEDEARTVAANYDARRGKVEADQKVLADQLKTAREEAKGVLAKAQSKLEEVNKQLGAAIVLTKEQAGIIRGITSETVDVPQGEIRWVNQRDRTVWINLGRADHLSRGMGFAVYSADISSMDKGAKKAGVEVTQILGEHLAEARIVEDEIADPIMPGDKIHTPVWNPGEQKRIALAGFIDIDGDGREDQELLKRIITANGGTIDCEAVGGKRIGKITPATRYLILGEAPDVKTDAKQLQPWNEMMDQADRLGTQKISVNDLLQKMGWKNQSPVQHFGPEAKPSDFRARAPEGAQRRSTGNVSEIFQPRRPPGGSRDSAY